MNAYNVLVFFRKSMHDPWEWKHVAVSSVCDTDALVAALAVIRSAGYQPRAEVVQ